MPNVQVEHLDDTRALITLQLEPADYQAGLKKQIKDIQKNAAFKGFRPGKAPEALVWSRYGKATLLEQVEKLVNQTIKEQMEQLPTAILEILPDDTVQNPPFQAQQPHTYVFRYEVGLCPMLTSLRGLDTDKEFSLYAFTPDEQEFADYLDSAARQYGTVSSSDQVNFDDNLYEVVLGVSAQARNDSQELEALLGQDATVSRAVISEGLQALLEGRMVNDTVSITDDVAAVFQHQIEPYWLYRSLGVRSLEGVASVQLTIREIRSKQPLTSRLELATQMYPDHAAQTEDEATAYILEQYEQQMGTNRALLRQQIMDWLQEQNPIAVSEDFVRRYVVSRIKPEYANDEARITETTRSFIKRIHRDRILAAIAKMDGAARELSQEAVMEAVYQHVDSEMADRQLLGTPYASYYRKQLARNMANDSDFMSEQVFPLAYRNLMLDFLAGRVLRVNTVKVTHEQYRQLMGTAETTALSASEA